MESSGAGTRERAIQSMKEYFQEEKLINHTLKVLSQAEKILEEERVAGEFMRVVVALGSIYHDIGIPEARKKYSSIDAPFQEKEGPPVARRLMAEIGVQPDIAERVCYIVGSHHTREKVDGMDFQIIWEADFIVNVEEKNVVVKKEELMRALEENTNTRAGRQLASEVLNRMSS